MAKEYGKRILICFIGVMLCGMACSLGAMAGAVCATIDGMHLQGVAGSIAGDDTIFICTLNNEFAEQIKESLISIKG